MKALVKTSEAVGYEYKDVDMPKIGPKDVLVKIMGTTICGSDIHAYHSSPNIILKEARVHGVFGRVVWQTWWQVRAMLDTGKFDPLPIITHRFPLAEFEQAFKLAESGEGGKILLIP